jgi:hypothetical protein
MISATDIDPSPGVPHANAAAYRRSSTQVKTPRTLGTPHPRCDRDIDVVVAAHVGRRVDDEQQLLDGYTAPHSTDGRRAIKQRLPRMSAEA